MTHFPKTKQWPPIFCALGSFFIKNAVKFYEPLNTVKFMVLVFEMTKDSLDGNCKNPATIGWFLTPSIYFWSAAMITKNHLQFSL